MGSVKLGILTEKPSARRNFAKALGGDKGTYAGEAYVLTNALGHLFGLDDPDKQVVPALAEKYRLWDLENLPWDPMEMAWKRKVVTGDVKKILTSIRQTLSSCDEIVIASDDDPTGEGSLLAWEIIDELKLSHKKISRMYFVDEAPKSIQKAFQNRVALTTSNADPDYRKAYFRSRWDFLSMQFTRIATKYNPARTVLRNGRLKSAMNLLVGQQWDAIHAYKKVPSYENRFRDENGVVYSSSNEPNFPTKEEVPSIYHASNVVVDSKTLKKTAPPKLLDLAALSGILSARGFSAKTILSTYQKMYEAQIVSYPRTEDKVITPEQFDELLPLVDKIADVVGANKSLLTHRTKRSTHVKTGGSHGANRPGTNVPASLSALEAAYGKVGVAIYETLCRNYLAMLAEDYAYENQKGHLKEYPSFTGSSNVPKAMGFKAIFSEDDSIDTNEKGLGTRAEPFIYEGFPPKPQEPTVKWLMSQLEKYDVGTGATRTQKYAEVTDTRVKAPLLKETRGKISLTEFGEMNYYLLPDTNIGNLQITEKLMQTMREIAKGSVDPEKELMNVARLVEEDKETMARNAKTLKEKMGDRMPEAKGKFTQNEADYARGVWEGKNVKFKRIVGGYRLTDEEVNALLDGKTVDFVFTSSKNGMKYNASGKLANLSFTKDGKMIKYVGVDVSFPNSKKTTGPDATHAEGMWNGEKVRFKRSVSDYRLTDEEVAKVLAGETISITFTAKSGNPCTTNAKLAHLFFTKDGRKVNYVGLDLTFPDSSSYQAGVPKKICGHEFTKEEREMLEMGKAVFVEGYISKKGKSFSAMTRYGVREDGKKGIIFDFN